MRATLYLNGKKTTRKAIIEKIGKESLDKFIRDSKEAFLDDPYEQQSWWIGCGMLSVEFS